MTRLLVPAVVLLSNVACKGDPLVAEFDGVWGGEVDDDGGTTYPVEATFQYDGEAEEFDGNVDHDGWIYQLVYTSSDNKVAELEFANITTTRRLYMKEIATNKDGDKLEGNWEIDNEGDVVSGELKLDYLE